MVELEMDVCNGKTGSDLLLCLFACDGLVQLLHFEVKHLYVCEDRLCMCGCADVSMCEYVDVRMYVSSSSDRGFDIK
jgi:hypothetical protein